MEQRLVIAGLELVCADQEPVRILLDLVNDLARWKPIQGRLAHLHTAELVLAGESDNRFVTALALAQVVANGVEILNRALDPA
jgi:hypothetical protein